MITDVDIEKLKQVFLTKEDAKEFATKDDILDIRNELKGFATKDDLKAFATKEDLKAFVEKDEFSSSVFEIIERIGEMKSEMKDEILAEFRNDLITFKDELLHEIVSLRQEVAIVAGYRSLIEDHEIRLTRLEKKKTN